MNLFAPIKQHLLNNDGIGEEIQNIINRLNALFGGGRGAVPTIARAIGGQTVEIKNTDALAEGDSTNTEQPVFVLPVPGFVGERHAVRWVAGTMHGVRVNGGGLNLTDYELGTQVAFTVINTPLGGTEWMYDGMGWQRVGV